MASTFSTSLKLELIGNGDQSGTWGTTTNNNLGTLLEQAITGVQSITMTNADYTLSSLNGVSDESRNAVLIVTGTNSAIRNIIAPAVNKLYVVRNNTLGGYAVVIKTSTSTGVTIANGTAVAVYCDGTEFYVYGPPSASTNTPNTLALRDGSGNFSAGTITANLIGTATNLAGGAANRVAYQSGAGTTAFLPAPTTAGTGVVWDGSSIAWGVIGGAVAGGAVYENAQIISSNYTMTSAKSGMSTGPITINSSVVVTIPSGSRWVIL